MTPEQLKWTDKQWAEYLGCSVKDFINWYEYTQIVHRVIIHQDINKKFYPVLERLLPVYRGGRYWDQWFSTSDRFDNFDDAAKYANEVFIPGLTYPDRYAQERHRPTKILHTLHVETNSFPHLTSHDWLAKDGYVTPSKILYTLRTQTKKISQRG